MVSKIDRSSIRQVTRYIANKLLAIFVIVFIGMASMYFSADGITAVCVGLSYLIAIGAVIVVIMADDYERNVKRLMQSGKL